MTPFADYHLHSDFSGDSDTPMESMIRAAIGLGLTELCFTEHLDLDYPGSPAYLDPLGTGLYLQDLGPDYFSLDIDAYRAAFLSMQERFGDLITLKFGVEIGLQPKINEENAAFVAAHPFDFVIASTHTVDEQDVYYKEFFQGRPLRESVLRYFEVTLENLNSFTDFDVYGHLDYIIRYLPDPYVGRFKYDYADYAEVLDAILKRLVELEKGLDVNTSHRYKKGGDINPSLAILKRFHELGGRIITFGSDAHTTDALAAKFEDAVALVKKAGFTEYCTFSARRVIFHELE
ncbi:MAG: histidinol-phosphatase HisJ family protein [Lachnospiraceae bacterium]|nr:histidinol-phosphatase HisJ family protein [Lachnospiraceae bacterium]